MGDYLVHLLTAEDVSPRDICILYNGKHVADRVRQTLAPRLEPFDVELSVQVSQTFQRRSNTILMTTSNSFKGYESEVVLIPCADQFVGAGQKVLANSLYVAMTRARSILAVYAQSSASGAGGKEGFGFGRTNRRVAEVLENCAAQIASAD